MNPLNDQLSSSEVASLQKNFIRFNTWRKYVSNPIKRQQKRLSKVFVLARDSVIQVKRYDTNSSSSKNKHNDQREMITINISGKRYQTYLSIFENYPNTLLGNEQKRKDYWDEQENEYFFDRHRACFEAILHYYQSNGHLRRPDHVPLDTFLEEISFFDLGPQVISQIKKRENVSIMQYIELPNWLWRRYLWFYLEYPQHSMYSRIIHFISMLLTVLSCVALAVETLPDYNQHYDTCENVENKTLSTINNKPLCLERFSSPFFIIQTICVSYFTIEFTLRLISAPSYYKFILSIYNWVDLSAIIPYFVFLGLELNHKQYEINASLIASLRVFRTLRFLRLAKTHLIFSQLKSLRVLSATLKESFDDFFILIIILNILGFLFGASTYLAEINSNGQVFDSIPKAMYWGIMTITTAGYGDMYPITTIGRIIACVCAYFGVAISGILVSILVDRYQRVYERKKFFPEDILSEVDPSESDHDEKQDFINKRVSEPKRISSIQQTLGLKLATSMYLPTKNKRYLQRSSSAVPIQLIISFTSNEINNKPIHGVAHEIMEELIETMKTTDDHIKFKLINRQTDDRYDIISNSNDVYFN